MLRRPNGGRLAVLQFTNYAASSLSAYSNGNRWVEGKDTDLCNNGLTPRNKIPFVEGALCDLGNVVLKLGGAESRMESLHRRVCHKSFDDRVVERYALATIVLLQLLPHSFVQHFWTSFTHFLESKAVLGV